MAILYSALTPQRLVISHKLTCFRQLQGRISHFAVSKWLDTIILEVTTQMKSISCYWLQDGHYVTHKSLVTSCGHLRSVPSWSLYCFHQLILTRHVMQKESTTGYKTSSLLFPTCSLVHMLHPSPENMWKGAISSLTNSNDDLQWHMVSDHIISPFT